ncbi:MAG: putative bifunctional diguanylate cyclase/phosphodiesterase [Actinomycetes bacterium]
MPDVRRAVRERPSSGSFERVGAAAVLLLAGWLVVASPGPSVDAVVSGAAWTAAAATAAWRCLRAAQRGGAASRSWRLLGIGAAAWAVGVVPWAALQLRAAAAPPFPTLADVAFLVFPLLAVGALLRFPGLPVSTTTRLRMLLDGTVVTSALVLLVVFGGAAEVAGGPAAVTGRLAFLVLDVLAATLAVLVLDRIRRGSLPAVRRAATAVAVIVVGDLVYGAVASGTGYTAGGPLDALWCAGFLLLASAAGVRGGAIGDPRPGTRLLPALPATAAGVALLLSGRLLTGLDPVLTGALVALGAALTARQVLLAHENAALHRSLEAKVHERTEQLQAAVDAGHESARTDALTGLPNRDGFAEAVADVLPRTNPEAMTAVVLLDLDRFQEVNDALGHGIGDTVLEAAAGRLSAGLRAGEVLARLGGDEFAVVVTGLPSAEHATSLALRLVAGMRTPLQLGQLEVVIGASAGIAVRAEPASGADDRQRLVRDLLRDADTALNAAKADGGNAVRCFEPDMHVAVRQSLQLQVDLRAALQSQQLHVHYQPVVDLSADRVVGVEALARWDHPTRGAVPPLAFISAAERSGLIVELERFVLDSACAQLARWRCDTPGLTVAINVSARHLRERDYLETVIGTLGRHRLPPSALVLEVTESLLFHDDDCVRAVLEQLHTAGVGLALDDFGTGYSSLSRLVDYPFDTLKVDRSFVTGLDGPTGRAVLTATLAMARGLQLRVVAEGVETTEQLEFLTASGCELAQGYLLSRPGPPDVVGAVLGGRLLPRPRAPR